MNTYIIYHQVKPGVDCPDGLAAAWTAKRKYPSAIVQGWVYQSETLPDFRPGDEVIIVDFSFPRDVMMRWAEQGVRLTVVDHHQTAMQNLEGLSDRILAKFDLAECGATLTWKTLFPDEPMPVFLEYVRDRDLWQHNLLFTKEIHEASASIKYKLKQAVGGRSHLARFQIFAWFDSLAEMDRKALIEYLQPIGAGLPEEKQRQVEQIASRVDFQVVAGFEVPVVILEASEDRLVSDVCQLLYWRYPEFPFVACLTSDGSWSLRSDAKGSNTDVGAIAKALGGGGNRNASGFKPTKGEQSSEQQ